MGKHLHGETGRRGGEELHLPRSAMPTGGFTRLPPSGSETPASGHPHAAATPGRREAVPATSPASSARRHRFPGAARPARPVRPAPGGNKVPGEKAGASFHARSLPLSCPLGLRGPQVKLARETRLGGRNLLGAQRVSLPATPRRPQQVAPRRPGGPATHAPAPRAPHPAPAYLSITPAGPHNPGSEGDKGGPANVSGARPPRAPRGGRRARPPPPGPRMAASGSPGPSRIPAPEETRETPRAAGEGKGSYLRTVPAAAAEGAEQGVPVAQRVSRGGGYRSALRPIVSLPGGSPRSRAREPGSSRPDTSCRRYGNGPASRAGPGPRLRAAAPPASRAAANRRRRGRGYRHLGGPFPAAPAAPRSRRRGRARLPVAAAGSPALRLGPGRGGRGRGAGARGTLEAVRERAAAPGAGGGGAGPAGGPRGVPESGVPAADGLGFPS